MPTKGYRKYARVMGPAIKYGVPAVRALAKYSPAFRRPVKAVAGSKRARSIGSTLESPSSRGGWGRQQRRAVRRRLSMPSVSKQIVRARGVYKGNFKKRKSKAGLVKYPCVCRDQRQIVSTDSEACYLAHITHPGKYVLRMISMCLVEKYMRKCGVKIMNWNDQIPAQLAIGTPANSVGVKLFCWTQDRIGTAPSPRGKPVRNTLYDSAATGVTFNGLSGSILQGLVAMVDQYANDIELLQFQWLPDVRDNQVQFITQVWDARDLMVEIKGVSQLHTQNRTEGGGAGASNPENELITSIYANPLHGKHYTFNGTGLRIKPDFNSANQENIQLVCDSVTGVFSLAATSVSLPSQAADALKEPPNRRYFPNCNGSVAVRLEPGAIKKSFVSAVERKSINGWITALKSWLSSGVNATGTESGAGLATGTVSKFAHLKIGKGAMLGMEKVCSFGVSDIVLSAERDAQYYARMWEIRRNYIPALSDQLGTIIANTLP